MGRRYHIGGVELMPVGMVTFLLTDVEGSTRLWEQNPDLAAQVLERHDAIASEVTGGTRAILVKPRGEGDSLFIVSDDPKTCLLTAESLLRAFAAEVWPEDYDLKVRMAIHTGPADLRGGDYYGTTVNRCARLRAIARGGQLIVSRVFADLVRDSLPIGLALRDLGEHVLKDLTRPEHVFQVDIDGLLCQFAPLNSLSVQPNNLPQQLTTFVGREFEILQVRQLLDEFRLITLVGSGGCGKSRLALQLAADELENFPQGVWFVPLAEISDATVVPHAFASVLGLADGSSVQEICESLSGHRVLIVLDTCEHVLSAAADLVERILNSVPTAKLICTSREPLDVVGERSYRVPSLGVPHTTTSAVEELESIESVQLFLDRARAVDASYKLTERNAAAIAQICRRLDGIALAIELAASRVRAMPAEQIAARLDDRFRLLTGGNRGVVPRQQTLHATLEWSYNLLSDHERIVFARCAVFGAGWTLEAAQSICSDESFDEWEVLDVLTELVDKSLVAFNEEDGGARYGFLESIRQYADSKLASDSDPGGIRRKHAEWFFGMVERESPQLSGNNSLEPLKRLAADQENVRLAFDCFLADSDERAAQMLVRLSAYYEMMGRNREGLDRADRLLMSEDEPSVHRGNVLNVAGNLAKNIGETDKALEYYRRALTIRESIQDQRGLAGSMSNIGNIYNNEGQFETAKEWYLKALELNRAIGNRAWEGINLVNLGALAFRQGKWQEAEGLYASSLQLFRELGNDRMCIYALAGLSNTAVGDARYREALSHARGGLELVAATGDFASAYVLLEAASRALLFLDRAEGAAHIAGIEETFREFHEITIQAADVAEAGQLRVDIAAKLGREEYERILARARTGGATDAIPRALRFLTEVMAELSSSLQS